MAKNNYTLKYFPTVERGESSNVKIINKHPITQNIIIVYLIQKNCLKI